MHCARRRIGSGWGCFSFTPVQNEVCFAHFRPDFCLDDFFLRGNKLCEKICGNGGLEQENDEEKLNFFLIITIRYNVCSDKQMISERWQKRLRGELTAPWKIGKEQVRK